MLSVRYPTSIDPILDHFTIAACFLMFVASCRKAELLQFCPNILIISLVFFSNFYHERTQKEEKAMHNWVLIQFYFWQF